MFEFHGWAVITTGNPDKTAAEVGLERRVREEVARMRGCSMFVSFGTGFNGMYSLTISGLRNHRREEVIDLFEWLAENSPACYGLLYVQDGEDWRRGADYQNDFRVWRLAKGQLTEHADPFLSPRIPTVEDLCELE